MPQTPREAYFVKRLTLWLVELGAFAFKTHGHVYQIAGLPDVIGCYRGLFFGFECKRPGKTASKLQEFIGKKIIQAGGLFATVTTIEEAESALFAHTEARINISRDSLLLRSATERGASTSAPLLAPVQSD